jgi:uncharacterized protein (UPF0276 family)
MNLPELGVGLIWCSGLDPVLDDNASLIDLVEVDPQSVYRRESSGRTLVVDRALLEPLRERPTAKLLHSTGLPVGGTQGAAPPELELLRGLALELQTPWISEHLSFNRVTDESGTWHAGCLLPPRQTIEGISSAVASIRALASGVPVPVAIETGVNYLQPRADELPDGEFVAKVAETADCGILLDLHNVWTNQRNGRQSMADYLDQLPLDRVWELHLGGGSSHRGYWLDVHSGPVPAALLELAARVVPRLPNLKAIVFELCPVYLPSVGYTLFRPQLEAMHRLWDRRGTNPGTMLRSKRRKSRPPAPGPSPHEWERTLGALTIRKPCTGPLADQLREDAGLSIMREMVRQFRSSIVVRTLRLSSRLIMLERGTGYLEELLARFWRDCPPQSFGLAEAEAFAAYLREHKPYVPFLEEVLEYDLAVIDVALKGEERLVSFRADPLPLLSALGAGRRPAGLAIGNFEVRVTPEQVATDGSTLAAMPVIH